MTKQSQFSITLFDPALYTILLKLSKLAARIETGRINSSGSGNLGDTQNNRYPQEGGTRHPASRLAERQEKMRNKADFAQAICNQWLTAIQSGAGTGTLEDTRPRANFSNQEPNPSNTRTRLGTWLG